MALIDKLLPKPKLYPVTAPPIASTGAHHLQSCLIKQYYPHIFSLSVLVSPQEVSLTFSRMSVHCICTERTRRKRCGYWLVRAVVLLLHPEPETSSFFYPNGTASVPMYVYCIQRGGRQQPSFTPLAARGNGGDAREQALVAGSNAGREIRSLSS